MKCEICHQADAHEVFIPEGASEDGELYVCAACAAAERAKRKARSQRTRKVTGLPPGVSLSITEINPSADESDETPPPFLNALVDAVHDMVSEIEKAGEESEKRAKAPKMQELSASRAPAEYRIHGGFHLEGLHLIGELEAVHRALHALGMELKPVSTDGLIDAGHVFLFLYHDASDRAKRVAQDLLREEHNARVRLKTEMPRLFGDSLCRALAILKNCRLLSCEELFDLLSPLRLAARERMLDGITLKEVEKMMEEIDLTVPTEEISEEERDRIESERADEMNRRFEGVMLNDVL